MTPHLPRLRPLVALVPLLAACASHQPNLGQTPPGELTGHVTTIGQGYWFRPCTAPADSLWVTFTGRSVAQWDDARRRGAFGTDERTYVRWIAARAKPGQVGPGGPALLVQEISEARTAAAADCGP